MMIEFDTLIFRSSGRRMKTVGGVVGLHITPRGPVIFTGLNGLLGEYVERLTPMERAELAVYMRRRWAEVASMALAAQAKEEMRGCVTSTAPSDEPLPADGCVTDDPHGRDGGRLVYGRIREQEEPWRYAIR